MQESLWRLGFILALLLHTLLLRSSDAFPSPIGLLVKQRRSCFQRTKQQWMTDGSDGDGGISEWDDDGVPFFLRSQAELEEMDNDSENTISNSFVAVDLVVEDWKDMALDLKHMAMEKYNQIDWNHVKDEIQTFVEGEEFRVLQQESVSEKIYCYNHNQTGGADVGSH